GREGTCRPARRDSVFVPSLPDRLHVYPLAVFVITIACAGSLGSWLWSRALGEASRYIFAVVAGTFAFFMWIAWPDLLPLGGGPDLAHHMVLINYIEGQWKLVHDPALYPYLGDMMDYTPGAPLLIALAGAWTREPSLRLVHPVLALTVALKAGFVFCIAWRLTDLNRSVAGVAAVTLLF